MSTLTRAQIGALLRLGLRTTFGLGYRDVPLEADMVFDTRSSNQAVEEDQGLYGLGWAIEKGEGEAIRYDRMGQGFASRYVHSTIALGVRITQEAIDDNLYFNYGARAGRAMARSMRLTRDVRDINVLNNATSASHLGGDGQPLASTAHPLAGPSGGTYANKLSTDMDISEAALEELVLLMRYCVDDRGLPIVLAPKRLFGSQMLEFDLVRLLKSTGRVQTADNDINALKFQGMFQAEPALLRHLTDSDAWGFTTDGHEGGLIRFERRGVRQESKTDFDTGDHLEKATWRGSSGWTDWRGVFFGHA